MISSIISFSVKNKLIIGIALLIMIGFGIYSITQISVGAVPDITNNQVQVITTSRNLSTLDVEQFITYPIELEMANLPGVQEIRSISKFGLSVVTIVFDDKMGTYLPRQLIAEKIKSAEEKIPQGVGSPEMGPISTGLGEIYQYTLEVKPGYEHRYSITDLRTIQDWVVKRHLAGLEGVVEVNTWGGFLKQYEVAVDPQRMMAMGITIDQVFRSMEANNENTGGSYIEKSAESYFVRGEGMVHTLDDIGNIVVKNVGDVPILIRDIGTVQYGHAVRFGAITGNGEGEKVLGQIMMLKGANASKVISNVKKRMAEVEKVLPEGVYINAFLERSLLINKTTHTVIENLTLGAIIVIVVLVILMGDFRSGLIVASVIPLSMLFGLSMMHLFNIDVNLMSLGAIDFGILVDGAVIIVEFTVFLIIQKQIKFKGLQGRELQEQKDKTVIEASSRMMRSAIFGQLIILIVFIPILSLTGIEGKMFRPMALSFGFILIGAMLLCLTYIPAVSALFIKPHAEEGNSYADRLVKFLQKAHAPVLKYALDNQKMVVAISVGLLILTGVVFSKMGGEFIPTLDEGDYVVQPVLKPGTSLSETVKLNTQMEGILMGFPEVKQVVTRIGAAEVPTDPMSMEMSDVIIILKDRKEWVTAKNKEQLADRMKEALSVIPGVDYEFTQPIEMRFNELITGVRADVAIKVYGDDLDILFQKGNEIKNLIQHVRGAADVIVEQIDGLPQVSVEYDRSKLARYGLNVRDMNEVLRMAFAGLSSGFVFEGERRFDLVVRLDEHQRNNLDEIGNLNVGLPNGRHLPLRELASITQKFGPAQISRDDTRRRIVVAVNVRNRDMESLVKEVQQIIGSKLSLPEGYYVTYGGQFENLERAKKQLLLAVPVALLLILLLLYFAFNSVRQALLVFTAIPLAAIGGVLLLFFRGMPFSISAGVGFIALFGIATLNGIILISFFNELKYKEGMTNRRELIMKGTRLRLRPVLLTASTAILGFFPMALSTSAGAEVQRPLATVVIGGLFSATLLTMIFLPVLYHMFDGKQGRIGKATKIATLALLVIFMPVVHGFSQSPQETVTLEDAIEIAHNNNSSMRAAKARVEQQQRLRGTAFDPGKTTLFYGAEEREFGETTKGITSYGVQQSIPFPSVWMGQAKILAGNATSEEYQYQMEVLQLEKEVSQVYYKLSYLKQKQQSYILLDSLYRLFYTAAERKHILGESGLLDRLAAQAKLLEARALLSQTEGELKKQNLVLKDLMQVDGDFDIAMVGKVSDDGPFPSQYGLLYHQTLLEIHRAESNLMRNQFLPDLNVGYFRQTLQGKSGFYGFEVGIGIPLWPFPQRSRVQASNLAVQSAAHNLERYRFHLQSKVDQLVNEADSYKSILINFEEQGLALAEELTTVSFRHYAEGETDYLHYLQSLEQATRIRLTYLDYLDLYNQVILELKYLQ